MADEKGSTMGLTKFDGSDYSYWKMQVEDYLFSEKLHLPLGEKPKDMKDEQWNLFDRQVLGMIRLTLSKNVAHNVAKEKITVGMMKALSEMYEKHSANNKLVQKDPEAAIALFWKAINAGDRVDSALKDMAVVMKQLDRAEEAIEAIKSFRHRCSKQAQESLDNVLIDLYKKCGKIDEQIEVLKQKLQMINQGEAFNGKPTKTARSHGKKFQVTIKQEASRILGNLGWAYMQQEKFAAAEVVYCKAQEIDPDSNKACNLCLCLIKQAKYNEARRILKEVLQGGLSGSGDPKSRNRAEELLKELEPWQSEVFSSASSVLNIEDAFLEGLDQLMKEWTPLRSRRLPIFEEISTYRDQLAC